MIVFHQFKIIVQKEPLIAIDGKEVRGSYDRKAGTKSLHLVSAWSTESQLVLAQTKVQSKSYEITAIFTH